MNVFCSWCNDPIKWAGIEYGVSHSICRRCCREHFPIAAVSLIIEAMEKPVKSLNVAGFGKWGNDR